MEKKVLVAVAAALMSSVGALHPESARADDAAAAAYEDSTVDASLDPGEERVSADADNQARLKDLRYAYFIGYNARAREDSKSYATLGDEVKHPQKLLAAPAMSVSPKQLAAPPKPVAERIAPPRRVVSQAASLRQVSAPVAPAKPVPAPVISPKRVAAARATPSRQVVAQAEPVPLKRVPAQVAPVPQKHVYAQLESVPPRRVASPVAPLRQASVEVTPPKRAEAQPVPLKQVSTRTAPPKLFATESEPPILIPTQAVAALPDEKSDNDDAQITQRRDSRNAQRAVPRYRQADEGPQYAAEQGTQAAPATPAAQNRQPRQYQNRQPQQYAAAPAYNQAPTESEQPSGYSGREYAPPPPRTVQAYQYAPAQYPPAQYQQAYAQSAYVPRPPTQAAARQVVIVGRPPAYPAYNQMYTPPELRRPYPAGYGNPAQPAGYQGWE
ncbi:hypothetical protein SBC1_61720 (plasmid) [Caballeronia sp. SBC1]|uniref:hypothetical protein n=1 Tax=unclassified Caballeronia TaxID=2646786 RepID=UPI0013E16FFF|nr:MULTISPECIES: hypothetical protein [unclassified Caballeronia]QIE28061.1 hypothetical protein SBC2_61370 [Caballeronia sp. SBC2]QIN66125.1 hypothetical protein SBC1_61720 [Caballeronia sp. SBC1]